ncbi:DUF1284 domain-containing protein [Propioniciclava tarda]|uniref:DUF1284 domain-containing protein n=1 Tax=Propioniciclava tarda TaxID=433330 RepID=A0A4Q9KK56_PROTD|nr:DUF1284 domain-containing protein [Propioniciclava tarda]TBT94847.1 DUF1284 domain-containing protein [Propioniciclava tarda]SMO63571.1 hypothetical protein SAMN06266982_10971 [Propioniciclava tarda]
MTIELRAHHLLCLLTYVGHGYTPAFAVNLDALCERLSAGEDVTLVEGPDAVCAPMLGLGHHCEEARLSARDAAARASLDPLLDLTGPIALDAATLRTLRSAFATGRVRNACAGCQWHELCTEVASEGFPGVRLSS